MRIGALMHQPAITCHRDESLSEAARLLWEHDIGALPVIDEDGRVVGLLTDRDACMAAYTQGAPLASITVDSAMSHDALTVTADDPVGLALRVMTDHRVRRIPVVDGEGRPLGMVSMNDVVRHAALCRRGSDAEYEVLQALSAVSQPRSIRASSAPAMPSGDPVHYVAL